MSSIPWGLRCESCITVFLDKFTRLLGPALVAFALCLILFCTYVYFRYVAVMYSPQVAIAVSILGVALLFNSLFYYWLAVVSSPGIPPLACEAVEGDVFGQPASSALSNRLRQYNRIDSDSDSEVDGEGSGGNCTGRVKKAVCSKCDRVRPPRTHHCSVCDSCIYRFDHHCPWIYNCVGLGNFKFFYLFLVFIFSVDMFFLAAAFTPFTAAIATPLQIEDDGNDGRSFLIMAYVLACAVEAALSLFVGFHTYLLLTNQTTMEWVTSGSRGRHERERGSMRIRNPYDLGKWRNIGEIFGTTVWWKYCVPFVYWREVSVVDAISSGLPVFPTAGIKRVSTPQHTE